MVGVLVSGLSKQHIQMMFNQGLDQKSDDKTLEGGKLLILENATFKKKNRFSKRFGYDRLANTKVDGTALSSGMFLSTFNDELLQYNNNELFSYSQNTQLWIDKGAIVPTLVSSQQIIKNTSTQSQCDSAVNLGVAVYAWEDSRGGVRASVYDNASGTPIIVDSLLDASASRVRCLAFKNYLFVFYYKSGSLFVRRVSPLNPTGFDSAVTVSSTINTANPTYDVTIYSTNRIIFCHNVQGSSQIKVGWLSDTPAVLTGALAPVLLSGAATNAIAVINANSKFYIFYSNTSAGLSCYILNNGGTTLSGPTVVDSYTSTAIQNITGFDNGNGVTAFYEINAAQDYNTLIKKNTITAAGSAGSASVLVRSLGLQSKAWKYGSFIYFCTTFSTTLQATYFVLREDGLVVAKLQPATGGGLTSRPILNNVSSIDSQNFSFAFTNKVQLISQNAQIYTPLGVSKTQIAFEDSNSFVTAQLGNNLHIAGGILNMYDGQSVVEHGFNYYPENFTGSTSGAAGLSNGVYQYSVIYEWSDNFGQIHRSTTGVPISVTVSGGPKQVDLVIPTLRVTGKATPNRSSVSVVIYRTKDAGSIFYRVTSVSSPLFNDVTADTVAFSDTTNDSTLGSNEILYTVGGVLDNSAAPSSKFVMEFKGRLWLSGLEDGTNIWYSQIHNVDEPVFFNDGLTLKTPTEGGGVSTMGVLDDKIVFFKADRFFITFGDGPNNTGQGGEFAVPQFVTADVGCNSAKSIVRTPGGLMFKTAKGIYSLSSALQLEYIGAGVEDYNANNLTSSVLKSDVNELRFSLKDGPTLVYDYYFAQWGVRTAHEATSSVIWNKTFAMLKTDGFVYVENPAKFKDDDRSYRMRIQTGWIAIDSQVGFQRIYKFAILGEYKSTHKLMVRVFYDYSSAPEGNYLFDPDADLSITRYGDSSPYGADSFYGGPNNSFRFTARLDRQKCQAIKFEIEDLTTSSTSGTQEAYTITALGLLVGVKGTLGKLPVLQKVSSV